MRAEGSADQAAGVAVVSADEFDGTPWSRMKLAVLTRSLAEAKAAAHTVPCWEHVDYECVGCPALAPCRDYARSVGDTSGVTV